MGRIKYYNNEFMVKISLRFPEDIIEWMNGYKNCSEAVRSAIDSRLGLHAERTVPEYKKKQIAKDKSES